MSRHKDTPKRDNPKVSHGKALTTLGAPRSPYVLDDTNTLDVQMIVGSLKSNIDYRFSDENVLAMSNGEIIQCVNAIQNSDGTYTISRLLRGCRGTDWACAMHVANENLVAVGPRDEISAAALRRESEIRRSITYPGLQFRRDPLGGWVVPELNSESPAAPATVKEILQREALVFSLSQEGAARKPIETNERRRVAERLLNKKGWTFNEWAQNSGSVDWHTVRDYVEGKYRPRPGTLKKLADSLGISVSRLLKLLP